MAERSTARSASAINWTLEYQPFVTTGVGVFPIGYLPIGALPMTGCGGGGWGCGRSAATAALSIPSDAIVTMRNFIPSSPHDNRFKSAALPLHKRMAILLSENHVNNNAPAKIEQPGSRFPAGVAA